MDGRSHYKDGVVKLHEYQEYAVKHLHGPTRGRGLFLDMGLGKTAIVLSALTPEHLPALVVAPKRVAEETWPTEARKWRPDLTVSLAAGSATKRRDALAVKADLYAIGRDNLADLESSDVLGRVKTLVLDELSSFKNNSSNRFKTVRRIVTKTPSIKHVWGLTGTPAPNGLLDLWSQMFLLDEGQRLGTGITSYRSRYFSPGRQLPSGVITEWNIRPGAETRIHNLIDDIALSMHTEGRLPALPPVIMQDFQVQLPPAARKAYDTLRKDLVVDLGIIGGEVHSAVNAAALSSKLSQISSGALYVDDRDIRGALFTEIHEEKLNAVLEIIDGTGSPVIVFYRFQHEKIRLAKRLRRAGFKFMCIDEPGSIQAWDAGKVQVMLAHPESAGHGLNLQHGGSTIVWLSLPWNLEHWQQGNKRLHRQGQKDNVIIHSIIATRTIDSAIQDRLAGKATVQEALMNHLESVIW